MAVWCFWFRWVCPRPPCCCGYDEARTVYCVYRVYTVYYTHVYGSVYYTQYTHTPSRPRVCHTLAAAKPPTRRFSI